jgi:hypothetical protein
MPDVSEEIAVPPLVAFPAVMVLAIYFSFNFVFACAAAFLTALHRLH